MWASRRTCFLAQRVRRERERKRKFTSLLVAHYDTTRDLLADHAPTFAYFTGFARENSLLLSRRGIRWSCEGATFTSNRRRFQVDSRAGALGKANSAFSFPVPSSYTAQCALTASAFVKARADCCEMEIMAGRMTVYADTAETIAPIFAIAPRWLSRRSCKGCFIPISDD